MEASPWMKEPLESLLDQAYWGTVYGELSDKAGISLSARARKMSSVAAASLSGGELLQRSMGDRNDGL